MASYSNTILYILENSESEMLDAAQITAIMRDQIGYEDAHKETIENELRKLERKKKVKCVISGNGKFYHIT